MRGSTTALCWRRALPPAGGRWAQQPLFPQHRGASGRGLWRRPPLPPPPRCPASSLRRAAGCAVREGARERERECAAERCCWKGSLKKVVGCLGAPAASWRSRASRRSTSSSPSPRPPPRPSAGPSAGTPTNCRRLSVSRAGRAAEGAAGRRQSMKQTMPRRLAGRLRAYRRSFSRRLGLAHCGGCAWHCSGAAAGCCKLYPPGSGRAARPRGAAAPSRTRRAPPGEARRRVPVPVPVPVPRGASSAAAPAAVAAAEAAARALTCWFALGPRQLCKCALCALCVCLRVCVCLWMHTCACIRLDYSAFFRWLQGGGKSHP